MDFREPQSDETVNTGIGEVGGSQPPQQPSVLQPTLDSKPKGAKKPLLHFGRRKHKESSVTSPDSSEPKTLRASKLKLPRYFLRYWYIFALLLVGIIALVFWQVQRAQLETTWNNATDQYSRGDYEAAAKTLEGVSLPNDQERLQVYSQTMLATRDLEKALPGYLKLYEVSPDPTILLTTANIYSEQKKYEQAEKIYKDLIAGNAGYIQAYSNLGSLYLLQGKTTEAIAITKQGVEANKTSVVLHEMLVSMLLNDKSDPAFTEAVNALRLLNPNDPLLIAIEQ